MGEAQRKLESEVGRPDIFAYHDYRAFLRDLFSYRKQRDSGFSLRSVCRETKLANGYLPMVLSGARTLSLKALQKLAPALALSASELSYLELLVSLSDAETPEARLSALKRIQRFNGYRAQNPREVEAYRYLTHWFYVAIREMAALPGFKPEAEWIQKKLRSKVPLRDIEQALTFLKENGFLEVQADGTARLPQKHVECVGGVFRIALHQFHREMLALAAESLTEMTSDERTVTGHTAAFSPDQYDAVRAILDEALQKIAALPSTGGSQSVYHVALAAFPLTRAEVTTASPEAPPTEPPTGRKS